MTTNRKPPSAWHYAFTFISLVIFSGAFVPLLRQAQGFEFTVVDGDPISQRLFVVIYFVTLLQLLLRGLRGEQHVVWRSLVWPLLALVTISWLWSIVPEVTLRRAIALGGTTLFGIYFAIRFPLETQVRIIAWACTLCAASSIASVILVPESALSSDLRNTAWQGIFVHKNTLGRIMGLGVLSLILTLQASKRKWLTFTALALTTLCIAQSSSVSAIVVTAICVLFIPFLHVLRKSSSILSGGLISLTLFLLGLLVTWIFTRFSTLMDALGRDVTLTGRTVLWSEVFDRVVERLWLGYGYSAFWTQPNPAAQRVWKIMGWDVPHAHNGTLEVVLAVGAIGLLLYTLFLGQTFMRAVIVLRSSKARNMYYLWPALYTIFYVLYNLPENVAVRQNDITWVLLVASASSTARLPHDATREAEAVGVHT